MYYQTLISSPVGTLTIACDSEKKNLVGVWIEGQKYHGDTILESMTPKDDILLFHITKQWLVRYFAGEQPAIQELPLAPIGSAFRQCV